LPDEQVFLAVAVDVREAWCGPAGAFDAHKGIATLESDGSFKLSRVSDKASSKCKETKWLHTVVRGLILWAN